MSRTILNRVRQENRPLLIRDANSEEALNSAASIVRAGIQAAFCSPLTFKGRFLGILYADNLAQPDAFSEPTSGPFRASGRRPVWPSQTRWPARNCWSGK